MKKLHFIVALLSVTLISVEMTWTRIFSAEYFYTFAFLILSLAILGMGIGALSLRLFRFLNNNTAAGIMLCLTAAAALAGPPFVIKLKLDFTQLFTAPGMILKLAAAIAALASSFFFGGTAMAYFFRSNNENINSLYMADLAGAAGGVAAAVILMNNLSTPETVFFAAVPCTIAAMLHCRNYLKIVPLIIFFAAVYMALNSSSYLDSGKKERAPVIYTHWDAMSKIKVYKFDSTYYGINIDNAANTPVYGFDGNWDRPDSMKYPFAIDVSWMAKKYNSKSFLSLGAGGGTDVLQALQLNIPQVYAVEVNPHINYMLQNGYLAQFSGYIYNDKRVTVVTEDARTYIRRFKNKFDIIYSLSSNSFAALASGSFALAENYLFTKEAFIDYWNSLSGSGFMMMEHQFYIPRLTAELVEALKALDVKDYKNHFAVYKLPNMRREMILISKQALTDEIRENAFGKTAPADENYHYLLYPAADTLKDNPVNTIVEQGWQKASEKSVVDITPATDNRPFTAQLGLWKNFDAASLREVKPYEFFGFPLSKIIIVFILVIIVVIVVPLNLLPYLGKGEKLKPSVWLYYFLIGAAFMGVEVVLIQKYSLFIGASVYSIAAVLLALLTGSATGSFFSSRVNDKLAFAGIIIALVLNITLIPWILSYLVSLHIIVRAVLSVLLIMPLGYFMGMPFPKGTLRAGELVDWGFAVNGAASVIGSVLAVYISFTFGFAIALLCAAVLYTAAGYILSLKMIPENK